MEVTTMAETGMKKEPDLKNVKRYRKDFQWTYRIGCFFEDINLHADFELMAENGELDASGVLE